MMSLTQAVVVQVLLSAEPANYNALHSAVVVPCSSWQVGYLPDLVSHFIPNMHVAVLC
jgi:hypothetical protein